MTAAEALSAAEDAGVDVRMSDDGVFLMLHGERKPESHLLMSLFSLKDEILALLRSRRRVVEIDAVNLHHKVIRQIADVEPEALASGWGFDRLWYGGNDDTRGLASVLHPGDRITEVTSDFIRIERTGKDPLTANLCFFRCDA